MLKWMESTEKYLEAVVTVMPLVPTDERWFSDDGIEQKTKREQYVLDYSVLYCFSIQNSLIVLNPPHSEGRDSYSTCRLKGVPKSARCSRKKWKKKKKELVDVDR